MFKTLQALLADLGGESLVHENALQHINTKVTDKSLIIEIFDTDEGALFDLKGRATPILKTIIKMMNRVFDLVTNPVSIEGHIRSYPIVLQDKPGWRSSIERALLVQSMFDDYGFDHARIRRVVGHADRDLATGTPTEIRNNRLEITLLRTGFSVQ